MENMKTMHAMKGSYRSFAIELVLVSFSFAWPIITT